MNKLDNKLIAKLVGYGRLDESAVEQAVAAEAPVVEQRVGVTEEAPLVINEAILESMHGILKAAGIADHDIALGSVSLNDKGAVKAAKKLTGRVMEAAQAKQFCKDVIAKLSLNLVEAEEVAEQDKLDEFYMDNMPSQARFTYVVDALGHVTVQDSESGKEIYLQGSDATELLGRLEMEGGTPEKEQAVLADYQHVMEDMALQPLRPQTATSKDLLASLQHDIESMKKKLHDMRAAAVKSGDVEGKFASEIFKDEVSTLEHSLQDYIAKISE